MGGGNLGVNFGAEEGGVGGGDYFAPAGEHHLVAESRPAEASTYYLNSL